MAGVRPTTHPEALSEAKPRTTVMRRPFGHARLAPELAKRQGAITRIAFERLGREAAMTFLNEDHSSLGGRPLDVATESMAGFVKVEAAIQSLKA